MRVLVTGACGTVGASTVEELLKMLDNEVIAIDLKKSKNKKQVAKYCELIDLRLGNLLDDEFVNEITKDVDVTIHLAAVIPPLADEKPQLARKVNVEGTEKLIECLKKKLT